MTKAERARLQQALDVVKKKLSNTYRDDALWAALEEMQEMCGVGVTVKTGVNPVIGTWLTQAQHLEKEIGANAKKHPSYPVDRQEEKKP